MKIIILIMAWASILLSKTLLGTDTEGNNYYCLDGHVYVLVEVFEGDSKTLIPVVDVENNIVVKLVCSNYTQWIEKSNN